MPSANTMSTRAKAILLNASIVTGLLLEYAQHKPLAGVLVAGILLLAIANLALLFLARKQAARRN
jgi:hypothetical protein